MDPASLLPMRRHAIASTLHVVPAILLYQQFLCPNLLVLVGRFAFQAQLSTPRYVSPASSLRLWAFFALIVNVTAMVFHWIDVSSGMNKDKSLILDFVGLKQDSSGTVVVLLDFVLLVIQLSTVYVAYLCDPLPTSSSAPTVLLSTDSSSDPLLPHANVYDDDENEAASDHMQSWTIRRRRRRKGKGRAGGDAYEAIVDEEAGIGGDVVDLNDDEEEGVVHERTSFLDSATAPRVDGFSLTEEHTNKAHAIPGATHPAVPLIFDLSFFQMVKHIFTLPAPSPAPRTFAGGTPLATPANLTSRSVADLTAAAAAATGANGNTSPTPRPRSAGGVESQTESTDEDEHQETGQSPPMPSLPGSFVPGSRRQERLQAFFSRPVAPSSRASHDDDQTGRDRGTTVPAGD